MRLQDRLTYANVVSTLCLMLLLIGGGTAYALGKNTVGSPQIIDRSIKAKDLGKGSVATGKLQKGAVANGKIRNGAVTGAKVKNRSLSSRDLHRETDGVARAGLTAAANGSVRSWFNRAGGAPTVEPIVSVASAYYGGYEVTIPRVDPAADGIVIVTARGLAGRSCEWFSMTGPSFGVYCVDPSGAADFGPFSVVVIQD